MKKEKKRVVVAMSGGVDSSVAAALLKEEGYGVIGVTMELWPQNESYGSGIDAVEEARKVAKTLQIPHHAVNFKAVFKKKVVDNFCKEYKAGKTPNPCIRCNRYIKFDTLLKKAKTLGADYIATGHYARVSYNKKTGRYLLKKGLDANKDQSYFLYTLTQDILKSTLFPLGTLHKEEVRETAKKIGLSNFSKPESQEICFIPDNNYHAFLKNKIPEAIKPGPIFNSQKKVIGKHQGVPLYTIGQRKGMGIAAAEPLYVITIDHKNNALVAGFKEEGYGNELSAAKTNFISLASLSKPMCCKTKIRYLHKEAEALLTPLAGDKVKVSFKKPQWAITPGQAVVFYDNDTVIGGGTITKNS